MVDSYQISSDFNFNKLKNIKDIDDVIEYIRDTYGWEITDADVDDITSDYEPKDLGIDEKYKAKIKVINRIYSLPGNVPENEPMYIFYIEFESKRLPVVVLKRILKSLKSYSSFYDCSFIREETLMIEIKKENPQKMKKYYFYSAFTF